MYIFFPEKKASILETKNNEYIKAFYHGLFDATPYLAGTTIYVTLSKNEDNVSILFQIPKAIDLVVHYWINWWRFVRDFCMVIGVDEKQTIEKITEMVKRENPNYIFINDFILKKE